MKKRLQKPLLFAAIIILLGGLVFGGFKLREKMIYDEASELYAAGDYAGAKSLYEKLGLSESAEDCDYQMDLLRLNDAKALLDAGEYDAAKADFKALGDFGDAAELVPECDYRKAAGLNEAGNYDDAAIILEGIRDYPPASELLCRMKEELYTEALAATYECRMDEAIMLWNKLGDYKDSQKLLKRCMSRVVNMASGDGEPATFYNRPGLKLGRGVLYYHRIGLIYVPDECTPDTPFMIFYPGGYDSSLANAYMTEFIYGNPPDAVMLFCYTNGYYDMEAKIEDSYQVLEQAALENGLFIHDLVLCGASMGSYTAANAAAWLHDNYGIDAKYVLSFDAGMHWTVPNHVLTAEQCDSAAAAGTGFMLFEGDGVGMNKAAIQVMVLHGVDVTIVHCKAAGHYGIIYDAMDYGMIHWALGQGELSDADNYTYIHLDKNSTYPD